MPVLLVSIVLGASLGLAVGGRFAGLGQLKLRWSAVPFLALLGQVAAVLAPAGARSMLTVLTQTLVLGWLGVNMARASQATVRLGGRLLAVGAAMNSVPMFLNGGMPVSGRALAVAGMPASFDVTDGNLAKHVVASSGAAFGFLGDVIPLRGMHVVISLGDVVMAWGLALMISAAMAAAPRRVRLAAA